MTCYVQLAGVTRVATVVAAVDSVACPLLFGMRNRAMACGVCTKVNLVFWCRHVGAAVCCIVNFMIAVGLRILVNDKLWHLSFSYG